MAIFDYKIVVKDIIVKPETVPKILSQLAILMGTRLKNRRLDIPAKFGSGYCIGFIFNEHIRMLILNYSLHENIAVENPDISRRERTILFKFQGPSILIATSTVTTDLVIPVHSNTGIINIEVDAGYLRGLVDVSERSVVLESLFKNTQPLLFEQVIHHAVQKVVDEIINAPVDETFELFFRRVKAEELICRLLIELEKRDEKRLYDLHAHDIQAIYKIKEKILDDLAVPPVINKLAAFANMSPSKLKRLFKQVFGKSIFHYYQQHRMKEAALLLRDRKLSVSEAGYQLGFTNMSHFSRVFTEHIGMKPKQYSRASLSSLNTNEQI